MPGASSSRRPAPVRPASAVTPTPDDAAPVFASLRRIVHALHTSSRDTEQRLGLTGAQLFVLTQLRATPSLSINELAERTMTHQSTVSVVVRRLVQRKLVRKVRAVDDARRVELTLTAAGTALLRKAPETVQTRLANAIEDLAPEVRRSLTTGLAQVVTALGFDEDPETMFFQETDTGEE
jgi:DNA-binding MarR family transcriptional regulator